MTSTSLSRLVLLIAVAAALACAGKAKKGPAKPGAKGPPPPAWVTSIDLKTDKLCGVGVAGAAFDKNSPYPKQLSSERAYKNLAGALETTIQEAIVDRDTNARQTVDIARVLTVDEALIEQVGQMAETEYWLDEAGNGPFAQAGFTYAHACIDAKVAASTFKIDESKLKKRKKRKGNHPENRPRWLKRTGKQPGGRLCAVGFSLPTFHPEKTFDVVVEDVRAQLAEVLQTLVSSYYEELSTNRSHFYEMMTVATTDAISKGAIITDYWYDRDGIGPFNKKRSTYGWGCVYPVDVMKRSVAAVEKELPQNVVAKVRERAAAAFDELDAEIDKRTPPPAGEPPAAPEPPEPPEPSAAVPPLP